MNEHTILAEAVFTKKVCMYWLLSGIILLLICVVTIPLIPIWCAVGFYVTGKYLERIGCTLTERTLVVRRGLFNRIEKTIPLEKITDLALKQGPIMRAMDLWGISVETAGSSGGAAGGSLVSLVGIVDTKGFRDKVLAQRDLLSNQSTPSASASSSVDEPKVLEDIRDTLHRIESALSRS